MEIIFLGTGSAIPIPRRENKLDPASPLHRCPQCRSDDPRDRRWPSSLLINRHYLIDAPPLIATLLQSQGIDPKDILTVFLTHRHADAAGGVSTLPKGVHQAFPSQPGIIEQRGHLFEAVKVPHDQRTWGYLVDERLAYFSDYADIRPALPALKRAHIAVLDGSGWEQAFPTHQPMVEVIPIVKQLSNLKTIYFTHVGHTHFPHFKLERKTKKLGDERFGIAFHGLKISL